MIIPKTHVTVSSDIERFSELDIPTNEEPTKEPTIGEQIRVAKNPLSEIYWAVKRAIKTIKEDKDDPTSPEFFKTIAIDTGQFNRLALSENSETEIPLPAMFIHYTNIRYLVQQNRIGEGRATMRLRFITNNLTSHYEEHETAPFDIFQRVNMAIQDAKTYEPFLNERCQLQYFDMPETTNTMQAYWVDYEVWFREVSAWEYRDWKQVHVIHAPFTNHSDQKPEIANGREDNTDISFDDVSNFYEQEPIDTPVEDSDSKPNEKEPKNKK